MEIINRDPGSPRVTTLCRAMYLLCAIIGLNALLFSYRVGIPLPVADAWHFLESFIRPALEGELRFVDLFVQRSAGDHSQPMQKLVLLADLYFFDLDFRLEAVFGVFLGVVTCGWLAWCMGRDAASAQERLRAALGGVAIFAIALSLNATNIYSWYLVALTWISLLFSFIYWAVLSKKRGWWSVAWASALATFVLAMILDELALPAFISLLLAIGVRDRFRRPGDLGITLLSGGAGLMLARWMLALTADIDGSADATTGSLSGLIEVITNPDAWKLVVAPLADSIVHQVHLKSLNPDQALRVQILITAVLFVFHGLFWWKALFGRSRPSDRVVVMAVSAMLFFYASIAGIALSRVPQFGLEYLHQPRYVVIYQLNIVALILMFMAPAGQEASRGRREAALGTWVPVAMVALLLAWQVLLVRDAWEFSRHIRNYTMNAANALVELGRHPENLPVTGCPDVLVICKFSADRRMASMTMLKKYELNIYSEKFRKANHLQQLPLRDVDEGALPSAAEPAIENCSATVVAWGPRRIVDGQPFNQQPNGQSAYWVKLAKEAGSLAIQMDGKPLMILKNGNVITFPHSDALAAEAAKRDHLPFTLMCGTKVAGTFKVSIQRGNGQGSQ